MDILSVKQVTGLSTGCMTGQVAEPSCLYHTKHFQLKNFSYYFLIKKHYIKMSDSESDTEITIANDLVVTKYKMAGEIANR